MEILTLVCKHTGAHTPCLCKIYQYKSSQTVKKEQSPKNKKNKNKKILGDKDMWNQRWRPRNAVHDGSITTIQVNLRVLLNSLGF